MGTSYLSPPTILSTTQFLSVSGTSTHTTETTIKMPSEAGHRLYVKARHLGYKRSKHTTHPNRSLVKIEGCDDVEAARFYLGKKAAFVYKAPKQIRGTKIRVIWGKVVRSHGSSGVVQARFAVPLPTKSFGASLRIMLYPSAI
ncbi:ribosomal protein L35Ae-domain-containing protein [Ustulina deusta]|nr:ribosomal protein L35Ae-domain-containing protein [Ustulina deusta]KAI3335102.1 ribosomal protein L35Ae-domain-containing protein [Ustulina deusta]